MIDIKKLTLHPINTDKYFDEDSLRELAASILKDGLIEPIIVRPQKRPVSADCRRAKTQSH